MVQWRVLKNTEYMNIKMKNRKYTIKEPLKYIFVNYQKKTMSYIEKYIIIIKSQEK